MGRPAPRRTRAAGPKDGLRRPRARLLGRSFRRGRRRSPRKTLRARPARAARRARAAVLRARQRTSSARPCATRSTRATKSILPAHVWGDGDARRACAGAPRASSQDTARAAAAFGVKTVTGFTGSSIWHATYAFPPTTQAYWDAGFVDFAKRFGPILARRSTRHDVNFALEVHPTEIAFRHRDQPARALEAVGQPPPLRLQLRPEPPRLPGRRLHRLHPHASGPRIFNAHMKDVWWGKGDGTVGTFGGHTSFGDARRTWDFRSVGRGMIDFESLIVALNDVGYAGPLSVEWEDSRMDRDPRRDRERGVLPPARLRASQGRVRRGLRQVAARAAWPEAPSMSRKPALRDGRRRARRLHRRGAPPGDGARRPATTSSPARSPATPEKLARLGPPTSASPTTATTAAGRRCSPTSSRRPPAERVDLVAIVDAQPRALRRRARLRRRRLPRRLRQAARPHQRAGRRARRRAWPRSGTLFAVTYNYTGYPMVREARELVRGGAIGAVRKVIVEYQQGWLAGALESADNKQSDLAHPTRRSAARRARWATSARTPRTSISRPSPASSSSACAPTSPSFGTGPIASTTTPASCCASSRWRASGVLLGLADRGIGHENDLRLRVDRRARHRSNGARRIRTSSCTRRSTARAASLTRMSPGLSEAARSAPAACRPGHPEGFIEAFANLYLGVAADLHDARRAPARPRADARGGGLSAHRRAGARGVRFIQKTVASSASDMKWTSMR